MLAVIVVVDHVPDYHRRHEAHSVAQRIDDPHQGPGKVVGDVLKHYFRGAGDVDYPLSSHQHGALLPGVDQAIAAHSQGQ